MRYVSRASLWNSTPFHFRAVKIRPSLFIVPLVLLALALASGSNLLLYLFFLSVLVLLVSYLWTRFNISGIEVKVSEPPEYCQVGERFDEEVTVFNGSKLPKLLLNVEENTDFPGHNNISVLNLPPGASRTWQTSVYCKRRGRYSLGSITAMATDPFGLFSQQRVLGKPRHILVYPATVELPFFEAPSLDEFGYSAGERAISQIGPNASSVREYTTSDSLNHIHWLSTAHTGKLMVKVFDADRSHNGSKNVWIVIDMNQASHHGEGEETTEEYGVTIAASLIKEYIASGMRVGLAASGDKPYLFLPGRGEQHLWNMMEALALMKATGEVPVSQLIANETENLKGNSTVIIIAPSGMGQVVTGARQLKNRGPSVIAVLLDSVSFGGTASPANEARRLISARIPVYIVRKGDELPRTLDSRFLSAHMKHI